MIVSIDKVQDEIFNNDDLLKAWCQTNLPDNFFKDTAELIPHYQSVVSWAMSKQSHYLPAALSEFLASDEADAWVIAFALGNNAKVVTYEKSQPEGKRKIKIPEPCNALGVEYLNTIEMCRELNVTF